MPRLAKATGDIKGQNDNSRGQNDKLGGQNDTNKGTE